GLVANGLGISVLVTRRAGDLSYDGKRVIRKPLTGSRVRQRVVLAWPDWSALTPPALALAASIRDELAASTAAS
ncbi:MAG TPA: hypothetical protein VF920_06625, partial [Dongiaceae bacterium]